MQEYLSLPICNDALKNGSGLISELAMSKDDIESLELQGYIKNAISSNGDTWKLTKKGEKARDFFLTKRSVKMRIVDWICRHILRLHVSI